MGRENRAPSCLCGGNEFRVVHTYESPPQGETRFPFSEGAYRREMWCCERCGHFRSCHQMDVSALYEGQYVDSSYGTDGLRRAFERITGLDPSKSDNVARVRRIVEHAASHFGEQKRRSVLDVGSGLCVFLHRMKAEGWDCTALDPDERAARHAREVVGVRAVCADYLSVKELGRYDVVAFNKVLEHVEDPVGMLARARDHVHEGGFVYVELPDGEGAANDGFHREEFFIEHHHVFSPASIIHLAERAGFAVGLTEQLREPSTKFTLRAFLTPKD